MSRRPAVLCQTPTDMVARVIAALALVAASAFGRPEFACEVRARTDAGWVCGRTRLAENGALYASFLGVPYARQPLGELRFKELEPPVPWQGLRDATVEGPVCYQTDIFYGRIMQPQGMSEACIHANIYVPRETLPESNNNRLARELQPPYYAGFPGQVKRQKKLPILVFIHGGAFLCGSGDTDLQGPEYLLSKKVIVITFNYRLNVFGFLSLNSKEIPGNQGLRDQLTLLRWVQQNAKYFGGDPENVTLMGQSSGATSVHLLNLSEAAQGLYKRAYLMSGTALSGAYSFSPLYAKKVSQAFLALLGINSTDTEYIHKQLIQFPIEKINDAHKILLDQYGLTTFVPTVEEEFPGVTRIMDDYPEVLIAQGRGKNVSLIIGFTDVECEVFRPRLEQIDIASQIADDPLLNVPSNIIYNTPEETLLLISQEVEQHYYNGTISLQGFIDYCTDSYFKYPALKLSEKRSGPGAAPVFLYQFAYDGEHSVLREALDLSYKGAAHIEDLTYVFKTNSILDTRDALRPVDRDDYMKVWMTDFLVNFMHCSDPVCNNKLEWPAVTSKKLQFQDIVHPVYSNRDLTEELKEILCFFDNLLDV